MASQNKIKVLNYEIKDKGNDKAKKYYQKMNRHLDSVSFVEKRNNIKNHIYKEYIIHSKLGDIYFFEKNEKKSIKHYKKAKESIDSLENFGLKETNGNKNILILNIGLLTTNLALKSLDKNLNLSNEFYNHLDILKQELVQINKNDLSKNELNMQKDIFQKIDGINKKDIYLEVTIQLPFPIMIEPKEKIEFIYCGINYQTTFELIRTNHTDLIINGCATLEEDRYGLLNRSKVKIKSQEYIPLDNKDEIIEKTLIVTNYIISHYKFLTKKYWMEPVNKKMITNFEFVQQIGEIKLPSWTIGGQNSISIGNTYNWFSKKNKLIESLNNGEIEPWKNLYFDAENNYNVGRFKEAILILNIAFESLIETKLKPLIIEKMDGEKGVLFFEGRLYEDFSLKKYISEETFNKMIKEGKSGTIPNVSKIVKKGIELTIIKDITNTQIDKMIHIIRRNRNDISHGRKHDNAILGKSAKKSIDEFKKFINLFLNIN